MKIKKLTTEKLPIEFSVNLDGDTDAAIQLHFGSDVYVCEPYYFSLHAEYEYQRTDDNSFVLGIVDTLKGWYKLLQGNNFNATIYFPYDLSDQCSRWIACTIEGESVELSAGDCLLEGYAINLTNPAENQAEIKDFNKTGEVTIHTTKTELDSWLLESIKLFEEYDS